MVETRRGRNGGSFVCGPAPAPAARLRARLRELSSVELRDLGDEWTAVAGTTAQAGGDHGRPTTRSNGLRTLADDLAASKSIRARTRANSRFAIELALAAQSERLTRAEIRLQSESGELLWTRSSKALVAEDVAADLHGIVDAVAGEDAELAAVARRGADAPQRAIPHRRSLGLDRLMSATSSTSRIRTGGQPRRRSRRSLDASTASWLRPTTSSPGSRRWPRRCSTPGTTNGDSAPRDLAALRPHIFEQLDRNLPFDSAGYVMSEPALADRPRHLEWWHRGTHSTYEELVLPVEPGAPDCYDYYSMEWFLAALIEQRRFASGPKIDLPCADVYIITFAYPVVADGTVLGVSAADVALSRFESKVRPPLQRLPAPAVLVNSERRVITSNDPMWTTGEKLRRLPAADEPGVAHRRARHRRPGLAACGGRSDRSLTASADRRAAADQGGASGDPDGEPHAEPEEVRCDRSVVEPGVADRARRMGQGQQVGDAAHRGAHHVRRRAAPRQQEHREERRAVRSPGRCGRISPATRLATPRVSIVTVPAANPTATSNGRWSSGMPYVGIAAASTVRAATTTRPAPTIACAPATDRVGTPKAANRRSTSRSRYDARMTGMPMQRDRGDRHAEVAGHVELGRDEVAEAVVWLVAERAGDDEHGERWEDEGEHHRRPLP